MTQINEEPQTVPSTYVHVKEFHSTYGQAIRTTPIMDIPEKAMRVALIDEESEELREANEENDFIEVVDAIADTLYVTYGAAIAHGLQPDTNWNLNGKVSPAEILKKDFILFGGEVPSAPTLDIPFREVFVNAVVEAAVDYKKASESNNLDALELAIINLIKASYEAAFAFGVDIDNVLLEVQRSNMSKLGEDGNPIYSENGKVLKGPGFFVPNITEVLEKQGWIKS